MRRFRVIILAGVAMVALIVAGVLTGKRGKYSAETGLSVTTLWKVFDITEQDEVACIARTVKARYLAAGNTYSEDQGGAYWVGEVGPEGQRDWERSYRAEYGEKIREIIPAQEGRFWAVGSSHSPLVWKFDQTGKLLFQKLLPREGDLFTEATTAMKAGGSALVIAGKEGSDAWVAKIDEHGDVIWTRRFDRGEDEWIMSAEALDQGHFILVAVSGKYDKFGSGFDKLWLMECDEEGRLVRQCTMAGRVVGGHCIALMPGRIFLAHMRSGGLMADAWITCLDRQLNKMWDVQVGDADITFYGPTIFSASDGNLVVCWNKSESFDVTGVDPGGQVLWRKSFPRAQGLFVPGGRGLGRVFLKRMR